VAQGVVISRQKFAEGGVIGGKSHAQGGTHFYGTDGSEFEAERGELLAIVNKKDTATLSGLSALNSNNGKPFFQEGGILPVGGITPPQSIGPDANNIIDSLRGVLKEEVGAIQIVNNVVDTENQLSAENTLVDRGSF
jgi:hypothetical protein